MFFGRKVNPAWGFGDRLKVFMEPASAAHPDALHPGETALVNASIESRRWLATRYPHYRHIAQVYSHTPRAMRKSVMHELEHLAQEWFAQVRSTVFRSWRFPPIVPDLAPRWKVQVGHAGQQVLNPLYVNTGDPQAGKSLTSWKKISAGCRFFASTTPATRHLTTTLACCVLRKPFKGCCPDRHRLNMHTVIDGLPPSFSKNKGKHVFRPYLL